MFRRGPSNCKSRYTHHRRWLATEALEPRLLLAFTPPAGGEPDHVFAVAQGNISPAGATVIEALDTTPYTMPRGYAVLGFHVEATGAATLDPDAVQLGNVVVTNVVVRPDLPGGGSLVLARVGAGSLDVTIGGEGGTTGDFTVEVFLAGDDDGSRNVDAVDRTAVRARLGQQVGDAGYKEEADANLDGRITNFDYAQTILNNGVTVVVPTVGNAPTAVDDDPAGAAAFTVSSGNTLTVPDGLTDIVERNDTVGTPAATISHFGGGSLGGSVTDNTAGSSVGTVGTGSLQVNANGSFTLITDPSQAGLFTFDYRLDNGVGTSDATVTVDIQDATSPTITITSPTNGSNVVEGSSITIQANATDNVAVSQVEFFVNGSSIGIDTTAPYESSSFVVPASPSPLPLRADASDAAGNIVSQLINVNIISTTAPTAVADTVAGGSSPGDNFHAFLNTTLVGADGSAEDLLTNDTLGAPAATLVSFGGGDLGGTVATNAAGASVPVGTGSLQVNGNGSFTFTPNTNFTGLFTFDYRIQNAGGSSDATVTLAVGERPSAVNDTVNSGATGNVRMSSNGAGVTINGAVGGNILNNDSGDQLSFNVAATSANSGNVTNLGGGNFTYNPAPGFKGADSFTYTIGNGFGNDAGTVSLTVADMFWFIDGSAGAGDGRLTSPFNSITSFNSTATDQAGDNIFLADGGYTGSFTLLNNQKLIGDGSSGTLEAATGITLAPGSDPLPTFSGTNPVITSSANGINLGSGNTVRGLTVGNTTGTGLVGTGVGALTVSETTVNGTGQAVDINTGALSATFDSISSSGATNGIVLANTTGSFTVTGDGSTATQGGNDTGGIITSAGDGIVLNNAQNITLRNMTIGDTAAVPANGADNTNLIGDDGIDATNVTNLDLLNVTIARTAKHGVLGVNVTDFTLDDSLVLNAGDNDEENGLDFSELRGDNFVTDSLFDAFNETGIEVINNSGTVDLTVSNTTFQDNKTTVGNFGEEAILLIAGGTAEIVALVTGTAGPTTQSIFDDIEAQSIQAISEGTSSNIELTVENSRFLEHDSGDAIIIMNPDNAGSGNVTVKDNFFTDDTLGAFALLAKNDSTGTLDVTVQGNTSTNVQLLAINHDGLGSGGPANGTTRVLVGGTGAGEGNTVNSEGFIIDVTATETPATGTPPDLSLTILNNTLTVPDNVFLFVGAMRIESQQNSRVNIDIQGNVANSDPSCCGGAALEIKLLDSGVLGIENLVGAPAAFLDGQNTFAGGTLVTNPNGNTIAAGNADAPTPTTVPNPLRALSEGTDGGAELTADALAPIVAEAISRWADTGLSDEQLAALESTPISIRDLPSSIVGYTGSQGNVIIDDDAAGNGWFVDATPGDDAEFGTDLVADASSAAFGRIDVLTAVMHELGHVLKQRHTDSGLMAGELPDGTRRLPAAAAPDIQPATKFYVVDAGTNSTFEYTADGSPVENYSLSSTAVVKGVAADATGSTVWTVDLSGRVTVYDADGAAQGSWQAGGLRYPQGIAVDGDDVWIVDSTRDRAFRYAGAAARTGGSQGPSSSIRVSGRPGGITARNGRLWVVDDGSDTVTKYRVNGRRVGRWTIDSANSKPRGITIDPTGQSDSVWIVDVGTDQVFEYAGGARQTSGRLAASVVFDLGQGINYPQGIADPPAASAPAAEGAASTVEMGAVFAAPQLAGIQAASTDSALLEMFGRNDQQDDVERAAIVVQHHVAQRHEIHASQPALNDPSRTDHDVETSRKSLVEDVLDELFAEIEQESL